MIDLFCIMSWWRTHLEGSYFGMFIFTFPEEHV